MLEKLSGSLVKAHCSIDDETVTIIAEGGVAEQKVFVDIMAFRRDYICPLGGFEEFAEYGMRWN